MQNTTPRRGPSVSHSRSAKTWKPIGDRLRQLREREAQSRTDASKATGVNALTLVRYESGSRPPSVDAVIAFARVYRVTTDWILGLRKAG